MAVTRDAVAEFGSSGLNSPADDAALRDRVRSMLSDPTRFSDLALPGWAMRRYQRAPVRAIANSVRGGHGEQHVLVFSRQAGKDELLAQLLAWVLIRNQLRGGNAVLACPTFTPQAALARDRLLERLRAEIPARLIGTLTTREGYVVQVGRASARFLSASPSANVRGQTADLLLIANEAQDIQPELWDAVFDPMAASTNATTVFAGTTWSRHGLLSRQIRHLSEIERTAGRRVWRVPWPVVAAELPAYGDRVRARIAQFGPDHPAIRTEYDLEELEGEGQLLPAERREQLRGDHPRQRRRIDGDCYALLIDVGGEATDKEATTADLPGPTSGRDRDSTALTVIAVERGSGRPTYRVVDRRVWTGIGQAALHAQIADLARTVWQASVVVVDATGIGAGLASFLGASFRSGRGGGVNGRSGAGSPGDPVVVPFIFTQASKSDLGWSLMALIDSGRLKEYADDGSADTRRFWEEVANVEYEVLPGPGQRLRWEVPPSRGHDDLVLSLALVSVLDRLDWRPRRAVGH